MRNSGQSANTQMKVTKTAFFFFAIFCVGMFSTQTRAQKKHTVSCWPAQVYLGEIFTVRVELRLEEGQKPGIPTFSRLGVARVRGKVSLRKKNDEQFILRIPMSIPMAASFGEQRLPPFEVEIRGPAGRHKVDLPSLKIRLRSKYGASPVFPDPRASNMLRKGQPQKNDISHSYALLNVDPKTPFPWLLLLLGSLGVLFVGILVWWLKKRRLPPPPPLPPSPHEEAMQRLAESGAQLPSTLPEIHQWLRQLSFILRTYIDESLDLPATKSTSTELQTLLTEVLGENRGAQLSIECLRESEWVRFSNQQPTAEQLNQTPHRIKSAIDELERWVQEKKRHEEAREAARSNQQEVEER